MRQPHLYQTITTLDLHSRDLRALLVPYTQVSKSAHISFIGCKSAADGVYGVRMHHGGTESTEDLMLVEEELTGKILGAAIEVHSMLGPGLLESAYKECLCHELGLRGIQFMRQVDLPVSFKGTLLSCGYRLDIVVADAVVAHPEAQLLTYLRLSRMRIVLLMNFNVVVLKRGIIRRVL